jgi:hypothetical protein
MTKPLSLLLFAFLCAHGGDVQRLRIGAPSNMPAGTPAFTLFTIDGAKKTAVIFQASDSDAVTSLLFRYGLTTGTPVQHKISIQGVLQTSSTGTPNGTVLAAGTFTPPADTSWNGLVQAVSITNDGTGGSISSYTLTRGNYYSIVIEPCPDATAPCSGTAVPSATNSSSFTTVLTNFTARMAPPYAATFTSAAWTKITDLPVWGYRTPAVTRGFPAQSTTSTSISSGTESAVSFTLPSTMCSTAKIVGVRATIETPNASRVLNLHLYSGTTILQSAVLDSDVNRSNASIWTVSDFYFSDASLTPVTCGSAYRIGFAPQDSSNIFALTTLDVATAGDRTAFPGGTMFAFGSRSGCGGPCDATSTAWVADTTTSRPLLELILDDLTPPVGTGGQKAFTFVGALLHRPVEPHQPETLPGIFQ